MTALALAGSLDFNPMVDELVAASGEKFRLKPPYGDELPSRVGHDQVCGHCCCHVLVSSCLGV